MCLAAAHNPFLSREEIVDREVVTDRIGLLVAGRASVATLLYLWTHGIDDVSPWMAHAAQWLDRYPIWRKAHDLAPSAAPVRVVLAVPGIGPSVRSALRLVSCPMTLSRYVYGEFGGKTVLAWDTETRGQSLEGTVPVGRQPVVGGGISNPEGLTPEEVAFFLRG
jgi:hypothetical protein